MNRMTGKPAIITGGALGIGRACAIKLAEEGAAVAITDLDEAEGSVVVAAALYCAKAGYNIRVNSVHPGYPGGAGRPRTSVNA